MVPYCGYESSYWINVALGLGIVIAMGAMGLAVLGSRVAKWLGIAALASSILVVAAGALAPYLPSGASISPELREWAGEQTRRHEEAGLTPKQIADRRAREDERD